jgi:hypothetical protein
VRKIIHVDMDDFSLKWNNGTVWRRITLIMSLAVTLSSWSFRVIFGDVERPVRSIDTEWQRKRLAAI